MMSKFWTDLKRYKAYEPRSTLFHLVTQRSLWAIFQYRVASGIYNSRTPKSLKKMLLPVLSFWRIIIEIITGISLPHSCVIGKGLYIGHAGNIIINAKARLGDYCNLSQGVTIGVSGREDRRGVPRIGNYVYIATNAVVVGKIYVGDKAVIGANSLVTRNVEAGTTVMGVPAVITGRKNSDDYIMPVS